MPLIAAQFKPNKKQEEFFNTPLDIQFKLYSGGRPNIATYNPAVIKLYKEFLASEEQKKGGK